MIENRPTINIYYSSSIKDESIFDQLLWGIEEEGIPYQRERKNEKSSIKLGYKAAEDSRLGVGIGVGCDGSVVLHYVKLKEDNPLFNIDINADKDQLRLLGANAARLVKGIPFKCLSDDEEDIYELKEENKIVKEFETKEENEAIDVDIKAIVEEVLKRLRVK